MKMWLCRDEDGLLNLFADTIPHNRKSRIIPPDGGHKAVWHRCYLLGFPMGYYEMIANCVDYAEYLAWQRKNRKKRKEEKV